MGWVGRNPCVHPAPCQGGAGPVWSSPQVKQVAGQSSSAKHTAGHAEKYAHTRRAAVWLAQCEHAGLENRAHDSGCRQLRTCNQCQWDGRLTGWAALPGVFHAVRSRQRLARGQAASCCMHVLRFTTHGQRYGVGKSSKYAREHTVEGGDGGQGPACCCATRHACMCARLTWLGRWRHRRPGRRRLMWLWM